MKTLATILLISFSILSSSTFASNTEPGSNSESPVKTAKTLSHADILGDWVFFKLQELDESTGETIGTYYAHSNYKFHTSQRINIDGTNYEWTYNTTEGTLLVAGINFKVRFFK